MSAATPDCTPKCRSLRHAEEAIAALTSGSESGLRAFLTAHCHNVTTLRDTFGRSALHLAASTGKRQLLQWLLDRNNADLQAKDGESGWTALHRSAFYGQIHCLMSLVKHGGSLFVQDKEGLSVLDLTMKDRPAHVVFRSADPAEVYTWGNNSNFSLGHGNQESRHHPEIVDTFSRSGVNVKQVVLCKFHSVFLSQKGRVYTCGHGQGGRLGHGDEQTYLLPRMVDGLQSHHCRQIAAGRDHTVVLTEEGYVYTFGLNTYHQLGLSPPPASSHLPKQVTCKSLKGKSVIGVAAGRFHTILWTRDCVYTMGLNGGQLGHQLEPSGEKHVTVPRHVSALHHKDSAIALSAASDGATVCVTQKGDLYLLADYQCKKLASKQLNLKKILVSGGSLDHGVDPQLLHDGREEKLVILALDQAGRVFSWRSSGSSMQQCRWAYGREVFITDMALSKSGMMFVTRDGEGFGGQWIRQSKKTGYQKDVSENDPACERIRLEKLHYVHRAVSITMDSKGCNFGVLQVDPKTSLYEVPSVSSSCFSQHFQRLLSEAEETDSIHDVTLQAGSRTFPAHKYILAMRSDFFRKVFPPDGCKEAADGAELRKGEDAVGCDLVVLEKVPPEMLEHALRFIYTDSCDMLVDGARPVVTCPAGQQQLLHRLQALGLENRSALDVYHSLPVELREEAEKPKGKNGKPARKAKSGSVCEPGPSPVKMLQSLAKKLGLGSLSARLDGVRYAAGSITVVQKKTGNKPRLSPKKCWYLCDVILRSEDGRDFPCHKCVLCARLEYFNSMLGSPWIEASSCSALDLPFSSDILQVVVEYIYTDESPTIRESASLDFMCNVLVVADQMLITRLKEICEVAITENLTLKNTAELLEFATVYNAEQLKLSCLQFIGLNMAALLESRALESLSEDVLLELTAAYRRMIPAMERRIITPYFNAPDLSAYKEGETDSAALVCPSSCESYRSSESLLKKAKLRAKRKPRRRSDSSGGYNLSDVIQSPPSSADVIQSPPSSADVIQSPPSSADVIQSPPSSADVIQSPPSSADVIQSPPSSADVIQSPPSSGLQRWASLPELVTSDSEASFLEANSPRDLQSPVFQEWRCAARTESPPDSPVLKESSQPKKSPSSPEPDAVLSRAAPVLDLRAIMEMEASSTNLGATPKGPSSKVSVSCKLSQKQRKMMALASREGGPDSVSSPKPAKTWSTAIQSPPSSFSFRDVLADEVRQGKSFQGSSNAIRSLVASSAKKVTFKSAENPDQEKAAGPWELRSALSPPSTFATILEEERRQEAALLRSRDKPLALIQIEERAIQELLLHYHAPAHPEEMIQVERTARGPLAPPTWTKR